MESVAVGKKESSAGIAKIKERYVISSHTRVLNLEFVNESIKEGISSSDTGGGASSTNTERKKLRGQNKKRPHNPKTKAADKLCPSVINQTDCTFNEKCKFQHNVNDYMNNKPPDIGPECHIYTTYGKCPYGCTCRFASQHTEVGPDQNIVNKVNVQVYSKCKDDMMEVNSDCKDLIHTVSRRRYNFDSAEEVVNKVKNQMSDKPVGAVIGLDEDVVRLRPSEIPKVDLSDKLYLAPLTTVGNLPFRRICKEFGADITCSEMAMCTSILQGNRGEWALLKRHHTEDIFGVQLCGSHADVLTRCSQLLSENMSVDFIDVNLGCPIDLVFKKGAGAALLERYSKLECICRSMSGLLSQHNIPLTVKLRTGICEQKNTAHKLIPRLADWGVHLTTLHGRSRLSRYTKLADWDYITECAGLAAQSTTPMLFYGCGDILSYEEAAAYRSITGMSGVMVARGALYKPWIFQEIKESRHWDISSTERFDVIKRFVNYGLEHWGSDEQGVETTRRFLLEFLSFLSRYIPVGLLEMGPPQRINEKPPRYEGRDELETLLSSPSCADWVRISEMLLGRVPDTFTFLPKHKASAYS